MYYTKDLRAGNLLTTSRIAVSLSRSNMNKTGEFLPVHAFDVIEIIKKKKKDKKEV